MPRVGHPWRKHFCDARFIVMEVDTSMMIILVMSWNTSTTALVWLSWFCHKIVMDVHAWLKTWPTVTNMYHHGSEFFCSGCCDMATPVQCTWQLQLLPHGNYSALHMATGVVSTWTLSSLHLEFTFDTSPTYLQFFIFPCYYIICFGCLMAFIIHFYIIFWD